jgi:hypothetical protein
MAQSRSSADAALAAAGRSRTGAKAKTQCGWRPVVSLWALVMFGLAFVRPKPPHAFFGVGAVQSHGHFTMVYLFAVIAVSLPAASSGKIPVAFPEAVPAVSTYAYDSKDSFK